MDKLVEKRIMAAFPDGRESSEFLNCGCCGMLVTGVTIGRITPNLTLPRSKNGVLCNNDQLTRDRELAWRICNNERKHTWCVCNWASGAKFAMFTTEHTRLFCKNDQLTRKRELACNWRRRDSNSNFPFPRQNINTGTLSAVIAEDGVDTLEPPEDKSIKALVIRGFNSRIHQQNIIDKFAAYGVIQSISFFAKESRALVTYTTREEAEKATQTLSKWLFINGQKLKLAWGSPQDHEPDMNPPLAMDLGAVISAPEVGGSSTTENKDASSSSSKIPILCPYCPATRDAVDSRFNDYQCPGGAMSPFLHVTPNQDTNPHPYVALDQRLAAVIASKDTLEPPEDKCIKTLLVCGFNKRILEHNIRDKFAAYGEIKSLRFFAKAGRALVTYTNRQGAEKATQALSKWLLINGQRLKLAWGSPQDHEPDQDSAQELGGSSTCAPSSS